MTIYITEKEMIERYVDGLKQSSSRAKEFTTAELQKRPQILAEFLNGVKVSAGSSHQLAHAQENPNWLQVRDLLEKILEIGQNLPLASDTSAAFKTWFSISETLENMVVIGKKMAAQAALTRPEVLDILDKRKKQLSVPETIN